MEDKNHNLATRAALINALLFPGWGEIYLKRYKRGILIIAAVVAGIASILYSILQATLKILRIAPFKKGTVTVAGVVNLAIDAARSIDFSYYFLILSSLIILWIASIFDAYHLGKQAIAKSDSDSPSPAAETAPPEK